MNRHISVKRYARRFRRPLRTAHGEWSLREGFLLRVEQAGTVGYGEVAPIAWFGSETFEAAAEFLTALVRDPEMPIPAGLPCCAFALSAALGEGRPPCRPRDYPVAALLPAGTAALRMLLDKSATSASSMDTGGHGARHAADERGGEDSSDNADGGMAGAMPSKTIGKAALGYTHFKWKIGVEPLAKELVTGRSLLESLPDGARLRLDANGALDAAGLDLWLALLAEFPGQVDFLEQPLAVGQEAAMATAMQSSGVPIALDESLNGADGARWLEPGVWSGPLVVKVPLMGDVVQLRERLIPVAAQVVLSSVFETGVGLENTLALADALPELTHPIGFDTVDAFDDPLNHLPPAAILSAEARSAYDPEKKWNAL